MADVRALPVPVDPYPQETLQSLLRRLCLANGITDRDVWRMLRRTRPELPTAISLSRIREEIHQLAGLNPKHAGQVSTASSNCAMHAWSREGQKCAGCRIEPVVVTLCVRCTNGESVDASRLAGPVCLRHFRWHDQGVDIAVPRQGRHLAAQRKLNQHLHRRGIGYRTPEAAATMQILHSWRAGRFVARSSATDRAKILEFPTIVDLMGVLADPALLRDLRNKSLSRSDQALLLSSAVQPILRHGGSPGPFPREPTKMLRAFGGDVDAVTIRFADLLRPRMPTLRARLLRHQDSVTRAQSLQRDKRN